MNKILFVSSKNKGQISPIVKSQGDSISKAGLEIIYFGVDGKGLVGYLSNLPKLKQEIKKTNPDLVHAHYSLSGFLAGLCFPHKPLVVSLMGSDTKTNRTLKLVLKFFSFLLWAETIVKSESMREDIKLSKAHIIPNGVNADLFFPVKDDIRNHYKAELGLPQTIPIALLIGDPKRESKNFHLAENAIRKAKGDAFEFVVKHGVPHGEIPKWLNAADILLLTSKWEGSPNIIKEAMACNCPVVATDVGDVKWLFDNEPGHFLTSFEPDSIAKNIEKALSFAKEHGRTNGRKRIMELGLDSNTVAQKVLAVYKKALK